MANRITDDEVLDWVSEMANDLAKISRPRSARLAGLFEQAAFTAKSLERSAHEAPAGEGRRRRARPAIAAA